MQKHYLEVHGLCKLWRNPVKPAYMIKISIELELISGSAAIVLERVPDNRSHRRFSDCRSFKVDWTAE